MDPMKKCCVLLPNISEEETWKKYKMVSEIDLTALHVVYIKWVISRKETGWNLSNWFQNMKHKRISVGQISAIA